MPDYMNSVMQGFQSGRQMRSDMETQRAMSALMANPNDPQAMQRLGQFNPQAAMQMQQRQQQQALAEIEAKQDKILMGAKIFRSAKAQNPNAPDEQVYASILPALGQMGINPAGLPQPGDPQLGEFLQSILSIADGLDPQKAQSRFVPVQPGGSVLEVGADGNQRWVVAPEGTVPQELTDDDILKLEGGQSGGAPTGGFL